MTQITLPTLLRRSLSHRRARSLSALSALTVSAAIATTLLTLFADLDSKLHHEFRSFGANLVLTIPTGDPNLAAAIQQAAGPAATVAAFSYAVALTDRGTPVVVSGVNFPAVRKLDSWWQLPAWPTTPNTALLGTRAANFIADEHTVTLTFAGHPATFAGAGRLQTGGDEDSRIYLPQPAFAAWTHTEPTVAEIQIPGGATAINAAMQNLRRAFPQATVSPVRQLVDGESQIVDRTHALLFAAVLLIALTVAVSVLATLSASILERRRDFALMKALGGTQSHLATVFLLETLVLALGGLALGYILGSGAAFLIAEANFHTATYPRLAILPIVALLNLTIAAVAALLPVRSLRTLEPASLLKGE